MTNGWQAWASPPDARHRVHRAHAQGQGALAVHGIAGVECDIDQRGFELARVDPDMARPLGQLNLHMNARTGDALEHLANVLDPLRHIEDFRVQRLAARERKQLAGQLAGALDGVRHCAHVALAPFFGQPGLTQKVHRRTNDGQQVVEVMGHAAGQLADGFEFLRLTQRRFGLGQRSGAFFHALLEGGVQFGKGRQPFAHGGIGAHPFDVRPGPFGDFGQQRQVIRRPGPLCCAVNRHQGRKATVFDQWYADRGGDAQGLERRALPVRAVQAGCRRSPAAHRPAGT